MQEGIRYLNSLGLHKVKPGLERIMNLLGALGNPQDKVHGIIIAGTNGKGSVAASISSILVAHGYSTGLYTSPHLINVTERIKINGERISESDLNSIILDIRKMAQEILSEQPSYFEVITSAAFVYFSSNSADFNVLEVGMGGRWDATNAINPLLSVITNVSLEHTEYLGETIKEIAGEKACIIKPGVPVISGTEHQALDVIENKAKCMGSDLFLLGRDFYIKSNHETFEYKGISLDFPKLSTNIKGEYQKNNIAIAIAAIEIAGRVCCIDIKEQAVRSGLSKLNWEGRFEVIRDDPPLILDSAHNPGAAKALVKSIYYKYPGTSFTFLIGMLDDKGHEDFFREISQIARRLIITRVPSERGAFPEKLLAAAEKHINDIEIIQDYKTAFSAVMTSEAPACVTGSIYLIGAVKTLPQVKPNNP